MDLTATTPTLALDFKSATLYTLRIVLHQHDSQALLAALDQRMQDAGSFFEDEAVVIDASQVEGEINWPPLLQALKQYRLHAVGVVANGDNLKNAETLGLTSIDLSTPRPASQPAQEKDTPNLAENVTAAAKPQPSRAKKRDSSPTPASEPAPAALVINRQLRSGQRVYARDTDLIVMGVVSQGAEVIADGNIHVYGPLRGKAMAGARGDETARIFTTHLDPELLAIAGVYRAIETQLEDRLHGQPVVVQREGDTLRFLPLDN